MKYTIIPLAALMALSTTLLADVKISNVFSDNMVLQREMKVPVWGRADAGEKVTVEFNGQNVAATAGDDGRWKLELSPMKVSTTPMVMTVKGKNTITIKNILIGDVWICSGQSNMGFTLEKDSLAAKEIPNSANPMIRMVLAEWQSSDIPLETVKYRDSWTEVFPASAGHFTAVGYWFSKEIQKTTGVPIGLLAAYKGGSPASAWLSKEFLNANEGAKEIWEKYQEALKEFPAKNEIYKKALKEWQEKTKGLSVEERAKIKKPNPPMGPTDPNHACGLFYGSVSPYIPFAIKGVLWYQGESEGCSPMKNALNYKTLFADLIRCWRKEWNRDDLPFLFVQLAPYRLMSPVPEDSPWSRIRDAQNEALKLPHTGMAVILDSGNEKDIHPTDKKPVGDRLAQWAKATIYGMDVVPAGPMFEKMEIKGDKAVVTFKYAGKGIEARDLTLIGGHELKKEKLQGFAICGADKKFVWADAQITAPNQVTVSAAEVKTPVAVRYAWASFPLCNLYNKDGFPASSFRTDNFVPGILPGAK